MFTSLSGFQWPQSLVRRGEPCRQDDTLASHDRIGQALNEALAHSKGEGPAIVQPVSIVLLHLIAGLLKS